MVIDESKDQNRKIIEKLRKKIFDGINFGKSDFGKFQYFYFIYVYLKTN